MDCILKQQIQNIYILTNYRDFVQPESNYKEPWS